MRLTKIIISAVTFLLGISTFASAGTDVGFTFGVKSATFTSDANPAPSFKSQAGILAGIIAIGELSGPVMFRTGGYYAERKTKVDVSGVTVNFSLAFIDVPVTALYRFNDMLGVFGGFNFGLRVSDSCTGNSTICNGATKGLSSTYLAATVGINAKFHPNWSGELAYEKGLQDVADHTGVDGLTMSAIFSY